MSALAEAVRPLNRPGDYDSLVERAAASRFALFGEASHGTHEFYRERAELTKRLIVESGFTAVAAEAYWPDAYRVSRFVRGESLEESPGRRSPTSAASRPGCGGTPTSSTSSAGCGSGIASCRPARPRSASTVSTSPACTPR